MIHQVTDYIKKCYTCAKFQNSNAKEHLLIREIANRPWEIIPADFFQFNENMYLLVVDTYTKYPEIDV